MTSGTFGCTGPDLSKDEPNKNGWLPIESAPKERDTILVTRFPATTRPPITHVRWSRGPSKGSPGWRIVGCGKRLRYEPTHWQPLPEPPEES